MLANETSRFYPDGTGINLPGAYHVGGGAMSQTWYNPRRKITYKVFRASDGFGRTGWQVNAYPGNHCGNCWEKARARYGL